MMPGYDAWKTRSPDDDVSSEEPTLEQQQADYEDEIQQMTVTEMWKPIASLSTEDEQDVELRMPNGNVEIGHFSPVQRRWKIRTGSYSREHEQQPGVTVQGRIYKLLEGVYPTHWRPLPHC